MNIPTPVYRAITLTVLSGLSVAILAAQGNPNEQALQKRSDTLQVRWLDAVRRPVRGAKLAGVVRGSSESDLTWGYDDANCTEMVTDTDGARMVHGQINGYDIDYALVTASEMPAQLEEIQKQVLEVIKKVSPATVRIAWGKNDGQGLLSGTIVTTNGHVATRGQHGLAAGETVVFYLADGRRVRGEVLGACWGLDIGLMKITEKGAWPHIELGKSGEAKAGALCLAMGYPILDRGSPQPSFDQEPSPRAGRILTSAAPLWFSISCPLDTSE